MRLLRLLNYIRLLMLGIQRIFTMEEVQANMYSEVHGCLNQRVSD